MKKRTGSKDDHSIPSHLNQATNLGTNSTPDTTERGFKDSTGQLDKDMGVSAAGLEERRSEAIRSVNKYRVVAVSGDAVAVEILSNSLGVLGDSSGIAGDGDGGEIGRHHMYFPTYPAVRTIVRVHSGHETYEGRNGSS